MERRKKKKETRKKKQERRKKKEERRKKRRNKKKVWFRYTRIEIERKQDRLKSSPQSLKVKVNFFLNQLINDRG